MLDGRSGRLVFGGFVDVWLLEAERIVDLEHGLVEIGADALVRLHEQRVADGDRIPDRERGRVATREPYPAFDEEAVLGCPACEGSGGVVGKSVCASHTQRASSRSSP